MLNSLVYFWFGVSVLMMALGILAVVVFMSSKKIRLKVLKWMKAVLTDDYDTVIAGLTRDINKLEKEV